METANNPWILNADQVMKSLQAGKEGLTDAEAASRILRFGLNLLKETKAAPWWTVLIRQFKSPIVALLGAAAVVSIVFGEWIEAAAVAVVILINSLIGFITELQAVRSMEALKRLARIPARVRRNGSTMEIEASDLVPGDILILEGGDLVPADGRIVQSSRLQADESTLTGESLPVEKSADAIDDRVLAERSNMVYRGTTITRGSCEVIVTATGLETELGKISALVQTTEDETTPLEKRLDRLAHKLIGVTLVIACAVTLSGILTHKNLFLMIETGIALAVAAVPEGLPIVATLALARGMWRMASRNALIRRLSAVETLGSTSVIFTDKTGTLTENRMAVTRILIDSGEIDLEGTDREVRYKTMKDTTNAEVLAWIWRISVLCNNAALSVDKEGREQGIGDPLETALLVLAKEFDSPEEIRKQYPRIAEEAFDAESKRMATFHEDGNEVLIAVKGAPESILASSTGIMTEKGVAVLDERSKQRWLEENDRLAGMGSRMLALATKKGKEPFEDLVFVGLLAMNDPPRHDVREAVRNCRHAGIRVVMVTGDQAQTASHVARSVDLGIGQVVHGKDLPQAGDWLPEQREVYLETSIFSRVTPQQKLDLIDLYQTHGYTVAMTGDGVNDAPALRKADIGVAMGLRGTQVAREAADMVLRDDRFQTIAEAVQQGRVIFNNIRHFVVYLLSCNISEVVSVGIASVLRIPLPILPLQILFLNLVTDVFPALALGMGEGDPDIMKQPPRPKTEPLLTRRHWLDVAVYGLLLTLAVMGSMVFGLKVLKLESQQATTLSFLTLAFSQIVHVFNMGSSRKGVRDEVIRNPYVWGAVILCSVLLLGTLFIQPLAAIMKLSRLEATGWLTVVGASLLPVFVVRLLKRLGCLSR